MSSVYWIEKLISLLIDCAFLSCCASGISNRTYEFHNWLQLWADSKKKKKWKCIKNWISHHKSIYACLHLSLFHHEDFFFLQKAVLHDSPQCMCATRMSWNFIYLLITKIGPLNVSFLNEGTNITHIRVMLCLINYSCIYIFGVSTFSIVSIQMKQ